MLLISLQFHREMLQQKKTKGLSFKQQPLLKRLALACCNISSIKRPPEWLYYYGVVATACISGPHHLLHQREDKASTRIDRSSAFLSFFWALEELQEITLKDYCKRSTRLRKQNSCTEDQGASRLKLGPVRCVSEAPDFTTHQKKNTERVSAFWSSSTGCDALCRRPPLSSRCSTTTNIAKHSE